MPLRIRYRSPYKGETRGKVKIYSGRMFKKAKNSYIQDMCNRKLVNVKSVSCRGVSVISAPCGVCPTCRKREQLEWSFRLKSELLSIPRDEWYCVFFTMTYNEEHLPHFPNFLKKNRNAKTSMCFSKDDIRKFHTELRYWLEREKGCKNEKKYKWMTCSEYGENTHRCHYHTLLCIPCTVNAVELFEKVNELWTEKGYIFPKKIEGGVDKYGYVHKPFVVESIEKAAAYCSKYISKDIAFEESINRRDYYKSKVITETYIDKRNGKKKTREKKVYLSDYTCFHLQSRSLGAVFVDSLDELKKLDFLQKGYSFVGDQFVHHVPRYMLRKILFENYYIKIGYDKAPLDKPKRVVCQRPTHFFYKYKKEVFNEKVRLMNDKIVNFEKNVLPRIGKITNECEKRNFEKIYCSFSELSTYEIAEKIVAYAGLNPKYCNVNLIPHEMYFRRYRTYQYVYNQRRVVECELDDLQGIYEEGEFVEIANFPRLVEKINQLYFWMNVLLSRYEEPIDRVRQQKERLISYINDSIKSQEV